MAPVFVAFAEIGIEDPTSLLLLFAVPGAALAAPLVVGLALALLGVRVARGITIGLLVVALAGSLFALPLATGLLALAARDAADAGLAPVFSSCGLSSGWGRSRPCSGV